MKETIASRTIGLINSAISKINIDLKLPELESKNQNELPSTITPRGSFYRHTTLKKDIDLTSFMIKN